jgi:hypothetical protein
MVMHVRSTDRILVLEKEDPKMSAGILDPAVFEGKNNLHLRQDLVTGLWNLNTNVEQSLRLLEIPGHLLNLL